MAVKRTRIVRKVRKQPPKPPGKPPGKPPAKPPAGPPVAGVRRELMPPIKCFFIEPTDTQQLYLRRYAGRDTGACDKSGLSYHNASVAIGIVPYVNEPISTVRERPSDDPRWPTHCACGYEFAADDWWQENHNRIYRRVDTGEELPLHDFGPGAMYYATWFEHEGSKRNRGPDGHCLVVVCPTRNGKGEWLVDSVANNCDMKCKNCGHAYSKHYDHYEDGKHIAPPIECQKYEGVDNGEHRCWVRTGDPRTGIITVDKHGNTCGAGAGSIMINGWHGHLIDGYLREC